MKAILIPKRYLPALVWTLFLTLSLSSGFSQMSISGPTCVTAGTQYNYTIAGNWTNSTNMSWSVEGGTISGSASGTPLPQIHVTFTAGGYVKVVTTNPSSTTTLNVGIALNVYGGVITNPTQTINYGALPAQINCPAASGGACSSPVYSYQWQYSNDNVNFSIINGFTSQNLAFTSSPSQTQYFRRFVTETVSGTTAYSTVATVTVYPQLQETIGPASQQIFTGGAVTPVGGGGASGGKPGCTYTYQWQYSADGTNYTGVSSGGSTTTYQPPSTPGLVYYRCILNDCNGATAYSNVVTVNIQNHLAPGSISPANSTVNPGVSPGQLTGTLPTGGFCNPYSYQWLISTGGAYTPISGATGQNYTPPGTATNVSYERQVTCGSEIQTSNSAIVNVNVIPGALTPATQQINYNAVPGALSLGTSAGGSGTFSYLWFSSSTSSFATQTQVGSSTTSYSPPALTATTYYRVQVVAGLSAYSSTVVVNVYPQVGGLIRPVSQSINYSTAPGLLTASGSGGNGTFSYQWYTNASGSYQAIGGATGSTYQPPVLSSTTSYEVQVTSNGASAMSAPSTVTVASPAITPGLLTPGNVTLVSAGSPGVLSCDEASGGNCGTSFGYQWQSSPDNSTWTNVTGQTGLSYNPGAVSATTYYRVVVTCNAQTANTNTAMVAIGAVNADWSFVRTRNISRPGVFDTVTADQLTDPNDVKQVTQYLDGLGRPMQSVARQASPLLKDMVTMQVYDGFGRSAIKYLPYTSPSSDGNYKPDPFGEQSAFNSGMFPADQFYYGEASFEASPLNRTTLSYAPGNNWIGSGRGVGMQYLVNGLADSVHMWSIAYPVGSLPTDGGLYAAGVLYKTVTTDEQNHQTVEYKDKDGRVILKKVQSSASPGTAHAGWLCSYYVYDELDNLRFIMSPQAVVLVNTAGVWSISATVANELCFRYEYDYRNRMIIKKAPGAGQTWMVYDVHDRLVMTQDSLLRSNQQWVYTKYDFQNRNDSTGVITDPTNYNNLSYHETNANVSANYPAVASYTNALLTRTFYDDYSWVALQSHPVGVVLAPAHLSSSTYFITTPNTSPTYAVPIIPFYITRGMVTGSMTNVIGTPTLFLYAVNFFDDRGRTIQTESTNYSLAIDTVSSQYNFSGSALRKLVAHGKVNNGAQGHLVSTKMDYDQALRLRHIWKNIDNAASDQLIDSIQYDELGRLNAKYIGNALDSLVYSYNIRGWLTGINKNYVGGTTNHWFGMELAYDNATSIAGTTYATPEYNGNIAGTVWKSAGDGINRKYDFTYDNVNRLTGANFNQNAAGTWNKLSGGSTPVTIDFSVSGLGYDANGNIQSMIQQGFKIGGSGTPIDSLTYTYTANSNKLLQVHDEYNDTASVLGDFHYKGVKGSSDYSYDGNGNLAKDNNKGLNNFAYNYLNLLANIHVTGKGYVTYIYDANGKKLQKQVKDSTTGMETFTQYIGDFQYQRRAPFSNINSGSDTLQFMFTEEGRVRWAFHKHLAGDTVTFPEYDFVERDHLGDERVILTQEKDTTQYIATMEAANRATENALFYNIGTTCVARTSVPAPGYPDDLTFTNPNDSVAKVNGNGPKVGPAIILKVMSGDKIDLGVQYYYNSGSYTSGTLSPQNLLNSLASGLATLSSAAGESITALSNSSTSPLLAALTSSIANESGTGTTKPQAYLNWVLLDNQFQYVTGSSSGALQVGAAGQNGGGLQPALAQNGITMSKSGYLYIYVSNATPAWDVFFDNLSIKQYSHPLLEENHYYPFGLGMAGISDKALKPQYVENKYRFNSSNELQNKEFADGSGLELYNAGFRLYDPQIGRFGQIDPVADFTSNVSPWAFVGNNPMAFSDPLGLDTVRLFGQGKFNIKIGKGDVLAWQIGNNTSYYTYDPDNKDAVGGFVGEGIKDGYAKAVVVTPSSDQRKEREKASYWIPDGALFLSTMEEKMSNAKTWFSVKTFKTYSQRFNGNQFTGGKLKLAGRWARGFRYAGWGLGAVNAYLVLRDNSISTTQKTAEEISNAIGTFGGIWGVAHTIGWEGGRIISQIDWYRENVRPLIQDAMGVDRDEFPKPSKYLDIPIEAPKN
jgi:RHS repeat-associated protein